MCFCDSSEFMRSVEPESCNKPLKLEETVQHEDVVETDMDIAINHVLSKMHRTASNKEIIRELIRVLDIDNIAVKDGCLVRLVKSQNANDTEGHMHDGTERHGIISDDPKMLELFHRLEVLYYELLDIEANM